MPSWIIYPDLFLSLIHIFVALTDNSETNILACLAAKRMGVTKTVAEVENIDYISMAESLDIGCLLYTSGLIRSLGK